MMGNRIIMYGRKCLSDAFVTRQFERKEGHEQDKKTCLLFLEQQKCWEVCLVYAIDVAK